MDLFSACGTDSCKYPRRFSLLELECRKRLAVVRNSISLALIIMNIFSVTGTNGLYVLNCNASKVSWKDSVIYHRTCICEIFGRLT